MSIVINTKFGDTHRIHTPTYHVVDLMIKNIFQKDKEQMLAAILMCEWRLGIAIRLATRPVGLATREKGYVTFRSDSMHGCLSRPPAFTHLLLNQHIARTRSPCSGRHILR